MFEQYKIQREKMPESLQVQMRIIREIAKAGGITVIEESGYEADDIIAAAAYEASAAKNKVVILTSDKDMIQLVNKDISILKIGRDGETVLTPESVREKMGIEPGKHNRCAGADGGRIRQYTRCKGHRRKNSV